MAEKLDVQPGTLALMLLKTLETMGPLHGCGIARRIEHTSGELLSINYGTLYPAPRGGLAAGPVSLGGGRRPPPSREPGRGGGAGGRLRGRRRPHVAGNGFPPGARAISAAAGGPVVPGG